MAVRRQAVVAWRDEQLLAAYSLFSDEIQQARASFEQGLVLHASLYDTVWDPAGFAEPRIDAELRKVLPGALAVFLDEAATALVVVSPEFGELAEALRRSDRLVLPQAAQIELAAAPRPRVSDEALPRPDEAASPTAPDDRWAITKRVEKLALSAGDAARKGAEIVQKQANTFVDSLQDKTGLHDRARAAAQKRIATHWMGESGDPEPVLSQLVRIIDHTTETARMSTL